MRQHQHRPHLNFPCVCRRPPRQPSPAIASAKNSYTRSNPITPKLPPHDPLDTLPLFPASEPPRPRRLHQPQPQPPASVSAPPLPLQRLPRHSAAGSAHQLLRRPPEEVYSVAPGRLPRPPLPHLALVPRLPQHRPPPRSGVLRPQVRSGLAPPLRRRGASERRRLHRGWARPGRLLWRKR